MSASEKLKALDVRVRQMPQTTIESMDYHEAKNAVADALPQIVAVVEKGQNIMLRPDVNGMPPRDCGYVRFAEIEALRDALAALDEALS